MRLKEVNKYKKKSIICASIAFLLMILLIVIIILDLKTNYIRYENQDNRYVIVEFIIMIPFAVSLCNLRIYLKEYMNDLSKKDDNQKKNS